MTAKQRRTLVEPIDLVVTMTDGAEHTYRAGPADYYRAEKIAGQPIFQLLMTYSGTAAIAWSCAVRAGHAFRQRNDPTDPAALVETWLDGVAAIEPLVDDDGNAVTADPTIPADSPA